MVPKSLLRLQINETSKFALKLQGSKRKNAPHTPRNKRLSSKDILIRPCNQAWRNVWSWHWWLVWLVMRSRSGSRTSVLSTNRRICGKFTKSCQNQMEAQKMFLSTLSHCHLSIWSCPCKYRVHVSRHIYCGLYSPIHPPTACKLLSIMIRP